MIEIPKPPPSLYVFGPLNFGSAVIMNGLIRTLARRHERLKWITKTEYINPVRESIEDLKNVQVLAAQNDAEVRGRWLPSCPNNLRLGPFADEHDPDKGESELYATAGVPFDARWAEFKLPARLLRGYAQPKRPIALVYDTEKFPVKPDFLPAHLDIFRILPRVSILDWLPEMFAASEIHFIGSAFLHLAESLHALGALPGTTLVYHKYAKPGKTHPVLRAPWRIFD